MEYKKVYINGKETHYRIYEDGSLMNEKTGRYYKGTIRNGYRWFDLRFENKKFSKSQHRLVAENFIPNTENLPYVHHIDGNRLNNSIENLQWISISENNLKENKKTPNKDHNDYNIYDGLEEWKTLRNTIYMVSNWGRVKNVLTDKILKGKITDSGYREFCLTVDGKKKSFSCHRIVYEIWHNEDEIQVINHIDGNKLNNRLENLEEVSSQENTLKAIYETKILHFKKTAQLDEEGNIVQIYMNNADAARKMGVKPQSIQQAILKNKKSCGYYWKNLE